MSTNYSNYLQLDRILNSQQPLSATDHDETLFIIIHQTYELWFKQILHETKQLDSGFKNGNSYIILGTLNRILTILKTVVQQVDILETMTPLQFSSFRDRLESSSGFQSLQFRELEFYLGFKDPKKLGHYKENSAAYQKLQESLKSPCLFDHFLLYLSQFHDCIIPEEILNRDFSETYHGSEAIEALLLKIYRNNPKLNLIAERLLDWDEGFQEWRYRHVKMVERTIGQKKGTGGSFGVHYLKHSLFKPAFPDLWNVRNKM